MCSCMLVCAYECMSAWVYISMQVCMYVCMNVCISECMNVCMSVWIYVIFPCGYLIFIENIRVQMALQWKKHMYVAPSLKTIFTRIVATFIPCKKVHWKNWYTPANSSSQCIGEKQLGIFCGYFMKIKSYLSLFKKPNFCAKKLWP
jgi:hypothetical protein